MNFKKLFLVIFLTIINVNILFSTLIEYQQGLDGYNGAISTTFTGRSQDPTGESHYYRYSGTGKYYNLEYFDLGDLSNLDSVSEAKIELINVGGNVYGTSKNVYVGKITDPDNLGSTYSNGWKLASSGGFRNGANLESRDDTTTPDIKWQNSDPSMPEDLNGNYFHNILNISPTPAFVVSSSDSIGKVYSIDVTSDIQCIQQGTCSNQGWAFFGDDDANLQDLIGTSNFVDIISRPKLIINFGNTSPIFNSSQTNTSSTSSPPPTNTSSPPNSSQINTPPYPSGETNIEGFNIQKYTKGDVSNFELYPKSTAPEPNLGECIYDPNYQSSVCKIADSNQFPEGESGGVVRPVYSRWAIDNSNGEFYYLQKEGETPAKSARGRLVIYNATDDSIYKIPLELVGHEKWEYRWDSSGSKPYTLYYRDNCKFFEYNIISGEITEIKDFTIEFPTCSRLINDVEGDSSPDSRYWAFMVQSAYNGKSFPMVAIITYDKETNSVISTLDFNRYKQLGGKADSLPRPNMVDISPDGTRILALFPRAWGDSNYGSSYYQDYETIFDGPHVYNLDFSSPLKVCNADTHGGWARDYNGDVVYVCQINNNNWDKATADTIAYTNLKTGITKEIILYGDIGWDLGGLHFGKFYNNEIVGWVYGTTYSNYDSSLSWLRNQAFMLEIKPSSENPRVWRISDIHNNYPSVSGYPREAYSPMSRDGQTIYWGSDWPGGDGTVDTYKVTLPDHWWVTLAGGTVNTNTETVICTPNWSCSQFNVCNNSSQTRTCIDYNNCNDITNKPLEIQSCTLSVNLTNQSEVNTINETNQSEIITVNEVESQNLGESSESKSSGSSSSGGSKRTFLDNELETEYKTPSGCISNFKYSSWSICKDETQSRIREDKNLCKEVITQIRSCNVGLSEIETKFNNAKTLFLEEFKKRHYTASFSNFVEFFKSKENIKNSFILYNEEEKLDYLAKMVDEKDGEYVYSIEVVDENMINNGILKEEGLIEQSLTEDIGNSIETLTTDKSYRGVIYAFLGLFFLTFILGIIFYFKKHTQKKIMTRLNEANETKEVKTTNTELGSIYSDEKVQRYSKYIAEIKAYIAKHPQMSQEQARENLERIGWNKEILDILFKK